MTCLCSQKVSALAELLVSLEPPSIDVPAPLLELSSMLSAQLAAQLSAGVPGLGLSAAALAQLSAVAQATASVKAGLGIDLLALDAQAQLDASVGAINANASAFLGLGALDPAPWMSLSLLASLALSLKLGLGVDIFSAGASAALSAALSACLGAPPLGLFAGLQASAGLAATASAMGVLDLSAGLGDLAARLEAVAELTIPGIDVSLGLLVGPLAILSAVASIAAGMGLNALSPGFPAAALSLCAGLSAFAELSLPAGLDASLAAAAQAALDAEASASLDLSALAGFQAPNLGPLTALASFSACCSAAGFAIALGAPCPVCPLSLALA